MTIPPASRIVRTIVVSALLGWAAACGGGPNTPSGSVVGSPGGPNPPPTQLVKAGVTIAIDHWHAARAGRREPNFLSSGTESMVVQLATVNGIAVTGADAATIDTYARAKNCRLAGTTLSCSGAVLASPGEDVFTVTAFAWPNGTGAVLGAGTIHTRIGTGGGTLRIDQQSSSGVGGVIASLRLRVTPDLVTRGKTASVPVTLEAFDAYGAQIVGSAPFQTPVTLSIQGDAVGAFGLRGTAGTGTTIVVTRPPHDLVVAYDGNVRATSIALQASVDGPNTVSASARLDVSGTPPPPPPGTMYVLNAGSQQGLGATVTVYDGGANGNVAPKRTLDLDAKLYARNIAVDASGNLYVGYFDTAIGFSAADGTPDSGNLIAIYAAGASGSAQPKATITADKSTQSALFPMAIAFDQAGNIVTYGATSVDGNTGDAVVVYPANTSGAAAPSHAWSFALPQLRYAGPTGLALDAGGNFYVNGALRTNPGESYGIFVNTAANAGNPAATPSRTIPWDATTKLTQGFVANVAIDASGAIVVANYALLGSTSLSCQGQVNVFAAGSGGGTTDVPPLRLLQLSGIVTTNPLCYAPNSPLAGFYPYVAAYGASLFVADEFDDAVAVFPSLGSSGVVKPSTRIAGAATGLDLPIGVVVSPLSAREASRRDTSSTPTRDPSALRAHQQRNE